MAPARARARGRHACARRPRATPTARCSRPSRPTSASSSATRARCSARPFPCMRRPNAMLAATSRWGKRASSWNISPIPRRCGGTPSRSRPSSVTAPASSGCSPAIARSSVDLPPPLGPRTATVSPSSTARSTPASASWPPSTTLAPATCSAGAIRAPAPAVRRTLGEQGGARSDRREDDGQRRSDTLVRLTGAAEEPEDRHGQRRLLGPRDEDGGAELPERDREREPGRDGEAPDRRAARRSRVGSAAGMRRASPPPRATPGRSTGVRA